MGRRHVQRVWGLRELEKRGAERARELESWRVGESRQPPGLATSASRLIPIVSIYMNLNNIPADPCLRRLDFSIG